MTVPRTDAARYASRSASNELLDVIVCFLVTANPRPAILEITRNASPPNTTNDNAPKPHGLESEVPRHSQVYLPWLTDTVGQCGGKVAVTSRGNFETGSAASHGAQAKNPSIVAIAATSCAMCHR